MYLKIILGEPNFPALVIILIPVFRPLFPKRKCFKKHYTLKPATRAGFISGTPFVK